MANKKLIEQKMKNKEVLITRINLRRKQDQERKVEQELQTRLIRFANSPTPPSISVVGNAQCLFEKRYGHIIDDADIVIRFNSGVVVNPEAQGTKTTMVIWSNLEPEVQLMYGDGVHFQNSREFEERGQLEEKLGHRPSNGMIALMHIRNTYQNSRVRIFGFDWKQTKTWYADALETEIHNFAAERRCCLRLIDEMGWELYR